MSHDPPLLIDLTIKETQMPAVRDFLQESQQILKQLKENLKLGQHRVES